MVEARVGVIGLGLAGRAIARRLIQQGFSVQGFDIAAEAYTAAAALGVAIAPDAATVGRGDTTLLLSLPDSDVVKRLLWDEGLAQHLAPGTVVLDTTTGRPQDARDNAARLAERQVRFVDMTLSGSSEDIAAGRATAMVGDREEAADYDPIVRAVAPRTFYLDAPGAGCLCKLVVNHIMGLNRAALAEGLAFGLAAGMDGEQLLAVIRDSAAHSRVADIKGDRMVRGDYRPVSKVALHAKDVRLILEAAAAAGMKLTLEEAHAALLARAIEMGLGDMDNAAIIEACRKGE